MNGSGDGVQHSESLDFWTLSIVRNSKYILENTTFSCSLSSTQPGVTELEFELFLRLTVSRPVRLGIGPPLWDP
jgi:hypothetical protein